MHLDQFNAASRTEAGGNSAYKEKAGQLREIAVLRFEGLLGR